MSFLKFDQQALKLAYLLYLQWISINEVSICVEINCLFFDNLHFPLADMNIEIWILKATVRKLLLSSIDDEAMCVVFHSNFAAYILFQIFSTFPSMRN